MPLNDRSSVWTFDSVIGGLPIAIITLRHHRM